MEDSRDETVEAGGQTFLDRHLTIAREPFNKVQIGNIQMYHSFKKSGASISVADDQVKLMNARIAMLRNVSIDCKYFIAIISF